MKHIILVLFIALLMGCGSQKDFVPAHKQAQLSSLCNISLISWDGKGSKPQHLGTITKYVEPIGIMGYLGQLYQTNDGYKISVDGVINAGYNAEIRFLNFDSEGRFVKVLGEIKMLGLGKAKTIYLDDQYIAMLSCAANK